MSAMDERTHIGSGTRAGLWRLAGPWWLFLVVWTGFFALFSGFSEIVIAFQLRRAQRP